MRYRLGTHLSLANDELLCVYLQKQASMHFANILM